MPKRRGKARAWWPATVGWVGLCLARVCAWFLTPSPQNSASKVWPLGVECPRYRGAIRGAIVPRPGGNLGRGKSRRPRKQGFYFPGAGLLRALGGLCGLPPRGPILATKNQSATCPPHEPLWEVSAALLPAWRCPFAVSRMGLFFSWCPKWARTTLDSTKVLICGAHGSAIM